MCRKQCGGLFEARGIVGTYAGRKYEIREVNSLNGKNELRGARKNDGGHFFGRESYGIVIGNDNRIYIPT